MSTDKQLDEEVRAAAEVVIDETPVKGVNVLKLKIDEEFDVGGDPYNRTGSHCVIKLDDDE